MPSRQASRGDMHAAPQSLPRAEAQQQAHAHNHRHPQNLRSDMAVTEEGAPLNKRKHQVTFKAYLSKMREERVYCLETIVLLHCSSPEYIPGAFY